MYAVRWSGTAISHTASLTAFIIISWSWIRNVYENCSIVTFITVELKMNLSDSSNYKALSRQIVCSSLHSYLLCRFWQTVFYSKSRIRQLPRITSSPSVSLPSHVPQKPFAQCLSLVLPIPSRTYCQHHNPCQSVRWSLTYFFLQHFPLVFSGTIFPDLYICFTKK